MSKANGKRSATPTQATIPAVGYLRRSTDKQEASIQEQCKAVQAYADEHGYQILRWYTDDAVSGDDTERRHEFRRMIDDAQDKADFRAILCWDQSRFGRFSPQEAGYWTWPLTQAGVQLITTDKGPIDWNEFTGWLTYSVDQHAKHQYLVNLGRDVTRGLLESVKGGSWVGTPPYGYHIEGPRKQKRLVLDDPSKVRLVQRIFREFVEEGRSLHNIASRLNAEGYVSPGGKVSGWRFDAIKVMLENPAYTGDFAGGRFSFGKYYTIKAGKVEKSNGRARRPETEWIMHRDHHEPIIDRATFEKAQAILERNRKGWHDKQNTGRSRYTPDNNPYVLSCLLRCGRCGCPLYGISSGTNRYYECANRKYNGKSACEGTTVREDVILREVADYLENWLGLEGEALGTAAYYGALKPGDLPEAFEEIRRLVLPPAKPKMDRKRLEKQFEQLTAKLEKARANLVLLDPDNIPAAQERIRQMDEERSALEKELNQSKPPAEKDVNAVVLAVLNNLYSLANCCRALARSVEEKRHIRGSFEKVAPQAVRQLLTHASHIVCHTERNGRGNGIRHVFRRGEIAFSTVGIVTGRENSHRPG